MEILGKGEIRACKRIHSTFFPVYPEYGEYWSKYRIEGETGPAQTEVCGH